LAGWSPDALEVTGSFRPVYSVHRRCRCLLFEVPKDPVVIPHTELSREALAGVVESFVLREGTDYGDREYSLAEKVAHVMRQIERGEAQIIFDPNTETVDIVARS
jgi:uncharacterized protein YheU (UPF0270 family)